MTYTSKLLHSFGLVLYWSDFVSDILVGVNLYDSCHYNWATVSFILTFSPAIGITQQKFIYMIELSPGGFS